MRIKEGWGVGIPPNRVHPKLTAAAMLHLVVVYFYVGT